MNASTGVLLFLISKVVIVSPDPPPERWLSWESVRYWLGGIEAVAFLGPATVTSIIENERGDAQVAASGAALNRGASIGLYGGPLATGWRFAPTGGWLDQTIAIQDVSSALEFEPRNTRDDIAGECSDPQTGASIDCGAPNRYDLRLQSLYGGVLLGYDLVVGGPNFRVMAGVRGDLDLFEYRLIDVHLADESRRHTQLSWIRGAGAHATAGFMLPRWHIAVRTTLGWRWHGNFSFGEPIAFQGHVSLDEERDVHLRPVLSVDTARYSAMTAQVSAAVLF